MLTKLLITAVVILIAASYLRRRARARTAQPQDAVREFLTHSRSGAWQAASSPEHDPTQHSTPSKSGVRTISVLVAFVLLMLAAAAGLNQWQARQPTSADTETAQ
jgi:ferric-dicitrate binding protein FerR (iron transport regulator)